MPYKCEKDHIPVELKRSAKITPEDKVEMQLIYKLGGISYRELGEQFGVSKSMAIYAVNPDRQKKNYALRVARGGSKQYYNKDTHTKAVREHRRYKQQLHLEGKLDVNASK